METAEESAATVERTPELSQTIFVLEDDQDISRLVQHSLEIAGFAVRTFVSPAAVLTDAERKTPDLFVLDIMVPGGDGLDLCRRMRKNPALAVAVIFLTARAAENDRVIGLELGADDYITKPFGTRELVARVKAVLRRFERPTAPSVVKFENVEIDAHAMQLQCGWGTGDDDGDGVPAAGLPGAASRAGVQPRSSAGRGMGRCAVCDAAVGGRVCAANSGEN